jgi:hypothetical protein
MHRGHHRHHHGGPLGHRGFHGILPREQQVDRLRAYREHLESELKNVDELLGRLADAQPAATTE